MDIQPEKQAAETPPDAQRQIARRGLNRQIAQRQKLLLGGIGALALISGSWILFGDDSDDGSEGSKGAVTIDTGGLVNRDLASREFVASYGNRLDALAREQKTLKDAQLPRPAIEQELDALRQENAQMRSDGQAAIDAISAENSSLKSELQKAAAAPPPVLAPPPDFGPGTGGPNNRVNPSGPPNAAALGPESDAKVSLLSFAGSAPSKDGKGAAKTSVSPLLLEDSLEYLPPNSYAPARVIVGVDASTGVASQSDPLPVVLRITGPARSVMRGNKLLTTDITGCLVNGSARGDLSAEKVYVKLARMTCAQPGGRYAISEVKGFISFAGKSGVRGRIVSREGSLVSQALLAGIVGGFGRGFSANANGIFAGNIGEDGRRSNLSGADILTGGLGQGGAQAADTVSKYLIERAEQYQPVVEMPTGISVEIVFLDGVHVRSKSK
ncbi:TraB/VirB10 family protein [Parasphingorhabdus sp. JC815]|uniref:TraB/VirB10 family protein n=1 Tax=Parasphingorhabdus sp. JC815 TaxID=3232140 RepID=UPI00345A3B23